MSVIIRIELHGEVAPTSVTCDIIGSIGATIMWEEVWQLCLISLSIASSITGLGMPPGMEDIDMTLKELWESALWILG